MHEGKEHGNYGHTGLKVYAMRIVGVDDAGRGSIIGPLAIAGVLVNEAGLSSLAQLGVKDSKALSPHTRRQLARKIRRMALQCHVAMLSPAEIDKVVETGRRLHRLNRLEAQAMARVISILRPDIAYVDAADVVVHRFREHIAENLTFKVNIVSEHKADVKYPIVSAASIIAKVERDRAIQKLQEKYQELGDIGSGYTSDPRTMEFLKGWIAKYGEYPEFVRKSWKSAKRLKRDAETKQTRLN